MIIQNGVVHPMDGPVIARGFVRLEGERITSIGPMESLPLSDEPFLPPEDIFSPAMWMPTAIWVSLETLWDLRPTTAMSQPIPVHLSCGRWTV